MIRLKITPRFVDSDTQDVTGVVGTNLLLEWVEVDDKEQIVGVVGTEEFTVMVNREGSSYITRGAFPEGRMLPGTFWVDEAGHRHFVMSAEAGQVGALGMEVQ